MLGQQGDDQAERGHRVGQRDGEPEEGGVGSPPVTGLDQVEHRAQHHLQHYHSYTGGRKNMVSYSPYSVFIH